MRQILLTLRFAALVFAMAFVPAFAQDQSSTEQEASAEQDVSAEQESASTDEEQDAQEAEDENPVLEVVYVRGIKQSMIAAQDLKMQSDSMLDAIVAEDIGKLPDLTAAESIARLPGVQVTRWNDEASGVLIRGLPDVTTTYNGREFFTAELRRAQLQDFPSQALAGIEVYKSATADLIEPGLAGLVNVRTRRPFDFEGQQISAAAHYGYNDQSEKASPAANILYSNRWETDAGEFGFLGNVTYAESKFYNGVRYNATWFPEAAPWWNLEEPYEEGGWVLPAQVGLYNSSGKRWRPSWNMALQWRPNDNVEVYFDGIYQGFRGEGITDNFFIPLTEWDWLHWNGTVTPTTDVTLFDVTMVPGTNDMQAASLSKYGGLPPQYWRSTNKNQTDTYQYAIGAIWNMDSVQVKTDLAYTDSTYTDDAWSFDAGLSYAPQVDANFFGDNGGVIFGFPEWDPTDLSTYEFRGYYESTFKVGGKSWQWRTDVDWDTGWGNWFHTVKAGVRYNDREATRKNGDRYAWFWNLGIPVTDVDFLQFELTHDPFRTNNQGFTQWMAPTAGSIQGNIDAMRAFVYEATLAGWDAWRAPDWESPDITYDPANNWLAEEQSYAAYVQTTSHFDIGNVGVDLFAGLRFVRTDTKNKGISTVIYDGVETQEPRIATSSYNDVFPNISFRANLTETLHLRGGFTRTSTKPNFGDLNPALNITQVRRPDIDPPPTPEDPDAIEWDADGSGGNPDLVPLTSDNYDISLEWYFSDTGFMSAAVFYRDLFGFTNWYTRFVETPDYGLVRLNRPENAGEGRIKGWELNAQTFLDFEGVPDWLKKFGISANVTKLDGENRLPDGEGNFGDFAPIPGLSEYTYNASIFYESDRFWARLSYNRREDWVNWYGETSPSGGFAGNRTLTRDRMDFSISYDLTDHIGLYADVANIMANPFRNYTVINDLRYFQDIRDEGRYYGLGIRLNY